MDRPGTRNTVACILRDEAVVAAGADGAPPCGDDGECEVAHEDVDDASSRRARPAPEGSRYAGVTFRCPDWNFRGCAHPRRLPYHRGTPSSDFRKRNFLHLKIYPPPSILRNVGRFSNFSTIPQGSVSASVDESSQRTRTTLTPFFFFKQNRNPWNQN